MNIIPPLGRKKQPIFPRFFWYLRHRTWLSLGKLWKQEGIVIKFLLFAICYVFVNAGFNWLQRTAVLLLCAVLLCYTGLTGRRTEGRRWGKRPREEDRFTTNKLRTQSGRIWDLLLILDGGSGDKLCNPSYFAFSCKLCFALLCVE